MLPERNGSFMKIKSKAVLAAACCAVLTAGCGDSSSVNGVSETVRTTVSTTAETTATEPASVSDDSRDTTDSTGTTESDTLTTAEHPLPDRAESALDSVRDAVTSLLTDAGSARIR